MSKSYTPDEVVELIRQQEEKQKYSELLGIAWSLIKAAAYVVLAGSGLYFLFRGIIGLLLLGIRQL